MKTLDGLARFYAQDANIRCLLNLIDYKTYIEIDQRKWESDYTRFKHSPRILTYVTAVP